MKDTINGIILVGMLVLGMFAFYIVGEVRHVEVGTAEETVAVEWSIEEEVALTEAETLEAHILAERAEKEDRKTTWYAAE